MYRFLIYLSRFDNFSTLHQQPIVFIAESSFCKGLISQAKSLGAAGFDEGADYMLLVVESIGERFKVIYAKSNPGEADKAEAEEIVRGKDPKEPKITKS